MVWVEYDLTADQRALNWMWLSAHGKGGQISDFDWADEGEPDFPGRFPSSQWFDITTGRAWWWGC
jgi:hypothetical protein